MACSRTDARAKPRLWLAALLTAGAVAIVAVPSETVHAKLLVGTDGADRLVGTAKPDRIDGRAGNDRIDGRQGRDRLSGGGGDDRIDAVDGRKDRSVRGGPGSDTCTVDDADRRLVKGCENVKTGWQRWRRELRAAPQEPRPSAVVGHQSPAAAAAERRGDGPPPTFSEAFYGIAITLNASASGAENGRLPISIEAVCDVPQALSRRLDTSLAATPSRSSAPTPLCLKMEPSSRGTPPRRLSPTSTRW